MVKQFILSGSAFQSFQAYPLVADDVNAYELVYIAPEELTDCAVQVTAIRADGTTVVGSGSVAGSRVTALLANNMYAQVGELKIRLSIIGANGSCLTAKEVVFEVVEGNGTDGITADSNYPILTDLIVKVQNNQLQIAQVEADAKAYADEKDETVLEGAKAYAEEKGAEVLEDAKSYADVQCVEYTETYRTTNPISPGDSVELEGIVDSGIMSVTVFAPLDDAPDNVNTVTLVDENDTDLFSFEIPTLSEGDKIVYDVDAGTILLYKSGQYDAPSTIEDTDGILSALKNPAVAKIRFNDYVAGYNALTVSYRCNAKVYIDSSIQQAVLDSWEVAV